MRVRASLRSLPVSLVLAGCANAAPLNITLTSSLQGTNPGRTITFNAMVMNTSTSTVFLNNDSVNVQTPLMGNGTPFLTNFPLSLAAGASASGSTFDITTPASAGFGLYIGEFDILGGSSPASQSTVGTAVFAVNVTPEPTALGTALAGALVLFLRRRSKAPARRRRIARVRTATTARIVRYRQPKR